MNSKLTLLFVTFVLAVGRQINCDCDSSMPAEDGPETAANAVNCEIPTSHCNASGGSSIQVGYEPTGDGLFRDPQEVLGPRFPACVALNTCELELMMASNEVTNVVFTETGKTTCKDVCRQYRANIRMEGTPEVTLTEAYCDYTGALVFRDDQEPELSSVCTCAYMVRCNRRTQIISYLFQSNPAGFLKVKVSETSVPKDIT